MLRNLPLSLLLLCTTAGAQTTLTYGTTTTGNLGLGAAHSYQFVGTAGETVLIWATRHRSESASFDPCVELRNPDGSVRASACLRGTQNRIELRLRQSGAHQIIVRDESTYVRAGAYSLTLQRLCPTPSPNAPTLAFGQTRSHSVSPEGDVDLFRFTAGAGVPIRLTVTKTSSGSSSYSACVRLYAPDCTRILGPCSGSAPNVINHTTQMSGEYVAMVFDDPTYPRAVSYTINLQCQIANCASNASYTTFGSGCPGAAGVPRLAAASGSLPVLGATFQVEMSNLPQGPFDVPFMFTGTSSTTWLGQALPFDLTGVGMAGCSALISLDTGTGLVNLGGKATWQVAVPLDVSLLGGVFFNQGVVRDGSLPNALGLIVTNGGRGVIG